MASYLGNSPETTLKVRATSYRYVATSSQTVFSGTDSNGLSMIINLADVEVFLNGVMLDQTDYTYTNTAVTLGAGATVNDIVEIITHVEYTTANIYSKEEVDVKVSSAITDLVGTAGSALNTLGELSDALGDDANYAATITTALGTKANTSSLATVATSGSYNDLTNKPTIPTVSAAAVSDQANTSTGYFDLPAGSTAQRPSSPASGMTRFNTDTGEPEWYDTVYSRWTTFAEHPRYLVDLTIVAGGGGGGGGYNSGGGGGGAGGLIQKTLSVIPGNAISIAVGAGGAQNVNGSPSSFGGFFTAIGGGYGAYRYDNQTPHRFGNNGGSGGGAAKNANCGSCGGLGIGGQGSNGGGAASAGGTGGGGGGGAGGAGEMGYYDDGVSWEYAGNGGQGMYHVRWTDINVGSPNGWLAGGGGAGVNTGTTHHTGVGGMGGGASSVESGTPADAIVNTGGGGGGGVWQGGSGSSGGSGIVIVSYPGAQRGTGGTIVSAYGFTHHIFTSSGTYTT